MPVPPRITELTKRFAYNLDSYRKGQYNETQVRLEYINPLMEELGWDMRNRQGYSEAYKDVIHEDSIKVGGVTKAPDYCFRVGGTRKFLPKLRGDFYEPSYVFLKDFPIPLLDLSNVADKGRHDQIVVLVDAILDLNKKVVEAKIPQAKDMLRRQIESTDRQIDQLVYKLYDLTDEEINIIESQT